MSASPPERLETLLLQLEGLGEARAVELARQVVQEVLDLHAAGLARVLQVVAQAQQGGAPLVAALGQEPGVANLLLLHGLHPLGLDERVRAGLAQVEAGLTAHGASVVLDGVDPQLARLRFEPGSACQGTQGRLRSQIEAAVLEAAPDVGRVEVVVEAAAAFVPLGRLTRDRSPGGSAG
jgi:hypothetical protein